MHVRVCVGRVVGGWDGIGKGCVKEVSRGDTHNRWPVKGDGLMGGA